MPASITRPALLAGVLAAGCRGGSVEALNSGLTLHTLPDCAPDRVERLVVEPLGDFAQQEPAAQARALSADRISFTGLPAETQWYRLRVETPDPGYRAFALGRVGEPSEPLDALVLPLGRTCSVHDAPFPSFASGTLALAGDDLLLAGGLDRSSAATRDVRVLRVDRQALASDVGDLDVKRTHATALALADETWVLGGAFEGRAGSPAWDTFERFDLAQQTFVGLGRMSAARVAPAALALPDGSALIAGGKDAFDGTALSSIESISRDGERAEMWSDELPFVAQRLGLVLRDDGSVVALGVADGESALASVEPHARGVALLELPPLSAGAIVVPALTVALPGARLALLELDAASETTTGSAFIMLEDNSFLKMPDPREPAEVSWLVSFAGFERARLLALPDGRMLLTGVLRDQPAARLLDPARRDVATRALDIEVERLFLRADGSVLMVGEQGVRILREDARSAFDNPGGNLLADDSGALCLDAYGRFTREGLGLRSARAGARLDLAPLRFRDVRIALDVAGPAELVFSRADGAQRSIAAGGERSGPAFCKLEGSEGHTLEIERREERITLRADGRSQSCQLQGMTGPISIAVRALATDVLIKDLRATRL
jgi:hypothetical protein